MCCKFICLSIRAVIDKDFQIVKELHKKFNPRPSIRVFLQHNNHLGAVQKSYHPPEGEEGGRVSRGCEKSMRKAHT